MSTAPAARCLGMGIYAAAIVLLPVFLFGAVSSRIRADLGLALGATGLAVGLFFGVSAVSVSFAGRFADARGVAAAMRLGAAITIGGSLLVVSANTSATPVFIGLAVCGLGNSLVSPAASRLIFHATRSERRGLMFGVKQASISIGIMLAGLALPTLANSYGWRSAFLFTVALTLPVVLRPPPDFASEDVNIVGPRRVVARESGHGDAGWTLLFQGLVFGFGIGSLLTLSTYVVDLLVGVGYGVGTAGIVLSIGALGSVLLRLVLGWLVDLRPRTAMPLSGLCILLGSGGFAVMSFGAAGGIPAVVVAAAVFVAYTLGWGWTGLVLFDIAHNNPMSVAGSTGIVLIGSGLGGSLGPPIAGLIFQEIGPVAMWGAAGLMMFMASVAAFAASVFRAVVRRRSNSARLPQNPLQEKRQ